MSRSEIWVVKVCSVSFEHKRDSACQATISETYFPVYNSSAPSVFLLDRSEILRNAYFGKEYVSVTL